MLHNLERATSGIGLNVNAHKTEYMCYNQTGDISTLNGTPLKLVDKFTYLGSSVSSTEKEIDTWLTKVWAVFLLTPTFGRAKAERPAWTYIQQLCEDTGCSPEDLPEVMNDREKWRERVRDIRTSGTTWWWWWWMNPLSCVLYKGHENQISWSASKSDSFF